MARQKQRNTPFFLTTALHRPSAAHELPEEEEELEFDESDVVWSDNNRHDDDDDTVDNNSTVIINTVAAVSVATASSLSSPRFTAGISAALLADDQPCSPTSIQRKTTSSPVSMISSSYLARNNSSNYTRGGGGGGGGGGPGFGSARYHMSAPVNVPIWPNRLTHGPKFGAVALDEDDGGEWLRDDDGEMVPPHEIVARSRNTTAFSVIEGAGRTLKGRDLTKVRNAVFQKTGFLD